MRFPSAMLCLVALAAPAAAAQTDVTSVIDAVTVYPDGATVTRVIRVELPPGDSVSRARDFPPGLDLASLRVEGDAQARLVIGGIDARPPRAERPPLDPELENRVEALHDERGGLDDKIEAASARKKFALRFADVSPVPLGEKGEARPLAECRSAFAAVAEEVAMADGAVRSAAAPARDRSRTGAAGGPAQCRSAAQDGGADRSCGRGGDACHLAGFVHGARGAVVAAL
jgi:hypothetical protein